MLQYWLTQEVRPTSVALVTTVDADAVESTSDPWDSVTCRSGYLARRSGAAAGRPKDLSDRILAVSAFCAPDRDFHFASASPCSRVWTAAGVIVSLGAS